MIFNQEEILKLLTIFELFHKNLLNQLEIHEAMKEITSKIKINLNMPTELKD